MICPNCVTEVSAENPAHENGCLIGACLSVLSDRGHDMTKIDISDLDTDAFWDQFGGPATDWLGDELGVGAYPKEN